MDVLIRGLKNFFRQNAIIQVRRIPPTKTLRAHLFGLTLALVGTFYTIIFDHSALFHDLPWYASPLVIGVFIFGTYVGGPFVILTAILFFFTSKQPDDPPQFLSSYAIVSAWYFVFYAIGAIFTLLYNGFVFLDLITFGKKQIKIAFAYDPKKKINIIKSPNTSEELAFAQLEHLAEQESEKAKAELHGQKHYHFHLDQPPPHPYTIAFVANSKIWRGCQMFDDDPIINDLDLFLRLVNTGLYSLEQDPIVGSHEIFSRVRVITIFDDSTQNQDGTPIGADELSLVQDFQIDVPASPEGVKDLIIPRAQMIANVKSMLERHQNDLSGQLDLKHIDVIYALSASPTQIRPTAYYSDFDERRVANDQLPPHFDSTKFAYNPDPDKNKGRQINPVNFKNGPFERKHDEYAHFPGRVAINVLSARRHTFIHEFGHAMSSALRGAICDEYYDESFLLAGGGSIFKPFYVNRIERVKGSGGGFVPVHQVFAKYENDVFLSDFTHPSAEESWLSYFPERAHGVTCTMDRTAEPFGFDQLIGRFIYERLVAKLNRKNPPPSLPT